MTQTTQTTDTALDRYLALMDRAIHDPGELEGLRSIFAPDAIVQLEENEPLTGLPKIMEFYRSYVAVFADNKHQWITTALDDGTLEARFMGAGRTVGGQLAAVSGTEYATVNADGLIANLRAQSVILDSWAASDGLDVDVPLKMSTDQPAV